MLPSALTHLADSQGTGSVRVWGDAQTVCVMVNAADRNRLRKHAERACVVLASAAQFLEAVVPISPLPPKIGSYSSTDPRFEVCEHLWGLAEAEVAAPPNKVWRQFLFLVVTLICVSPAS